MKLLAIEMSRLTKLFAAARDAGQTYLPEAASLLAARYKFASAPRSYDDLMGNRIEFRHGQFDGNAIESLEIYTDGIVVSSRSRTEFLDQFFSDFTQWIDDELGIGSIKTRTVDTIYDSQLIFQADRDILKPLEAFANIGKIVEDGLSKNSGLNVEYEPFGWGLATDPTQNPSFKPVAFRVERYLTSEFRLQQFISSAPLKTDQHLQALKKLESLV